jgi:hypothetical protein
VSDDKPTILYPFRKRDPLTGKWYRARFKASAEQILEHAGEWIVDGPPESYAPLGATPSFQPFPTRPPHVRLLLHPQREAPPAIDTLERFLAALFLRRYVTYCARRRRFAKAQGAAILARELALRPASNQFPESVG